MFNSNNGNGFSLSDIAAVLKSNGNDDGLLGGDGITAIILLIIVMAFFGGWNNGGFGGFGGGNSTGGAIPYVINSSTNTDNEISRGFDNLAINSKLDQLSSDICQGINGVNVANLQSFGTLNTSLCSAFDGVNSNLTNLGYTMQNDLLTLTNAIDGVKYENAANTAQVIQAQADNTQRLMDMITQNQIQQLRDELDASRTNEIVNTAVNNAVSALQPVARPSYIVASPYQSQMYGAGYCNCMNS